MMHRRLQQKRVSTASGFWSKGSDQAISAESKNLANREKQP